MKQPLSKFILEIRHSANARIIDTRGKLIHDILTLLNLQHWQFTDNRIDIYDETKSIEAFLSFRNLGTTIVNPSSDNFFIDKTCKYLKYVLNTDAIKDKTLINRIGVRLIKCIPYNGSFEELLNLYLNKYANVSPRVLSLVDSKIVDIGYPIVFQNSFGKFKITSSPMKQNEIKEIFKRQKNTGEIYLDENIDIPDVALYIDIDFWNNPDSVLPTNEVISIVKNFNDSNLENLKKISTLVLEVDHE